MSVSVTGAWSEVRLGDIGQSLIGLTYRPSSVKRSGTLVLRSSNIQDGRLAFDDNVYVDSPIPDKIRVRENDILICVRNGSRRLIGKSVRLDNRVVGQTFGAFMTVYRSDSNPFLQYFFQSDDFKRQIDEHLGATINQITNGSLNSFIVALPSPAEQHEVASRLADVDELIATLERLITKKQAIKQGAIQELLTGQTRLSEFRGVWEHRRVTEMGDVLAGKALNVSGAGALRPYLRTKNVLDGRIDLEDVLWMPMTDAEFERFCIERGDVLLNEGQSLELVGRCSVYNGEFVAPCAMQNQLLRFRAYAGTSPEFAAHLFRHCQRTGVFAGIATQTTSVAHLGSSRLSNLHLLWPTDRLEQVAIAEVLSDMDAEVAALEVRIDKTRAIKQGMMQQLLTGRTRLPVEEVAS